MIESPKFEAKVKRVCMCVCLCVHACVCVCILSVFSLVQKLIQEPDIIPGCYIQVRCNGTKILKTNLVSVFYSEIMHM